MKAGDREGPLTIRKSVNEQNCSSQKEIDDTVLAIGKTTIGK
jgi:hypothetical protein